VRPRYRIPLLLAVAAILLAGGDAPVDDTAALQALLDAPGDLSTFRAVGVIDLEARTYVLTDTVRVRKRSAILRGQGISPDGKGGTTFRWAGPANRPMLQFWAAEFCQTSGIRFAGDPRNPPSAAINVHQEAGDGVPTERNSFRDLFLGDMYGYDRDVPPAIAAGILFDGDNLNADMQVFDNVTINRCGVGIDVRNSQNCINDFRNLAIYQCPTGIRCAAENTFTNVYLGNCGTDIEVAEGVRLTFNGFHSEGARRLATFGGNGGYLTLRDGAWQVSKAINPDGVVIDGMRVNPVDVTFDHFTLNVVGGYAGPPPKIRLKSPPGGQGPKSFVGQNVPAFDPAWLDMGVNGPKAWYPQERRLIQVTRPGRSGGGSMPPGVFSNIVDGDGRVDLTRFDLPRGDR
jgi:hypothetical protein